MARAYDNSARLARARGTRTQIVSTAQQLLLGGGYPAMTVATLAAAAGVSPQTVYNAVGGKAEVVKAVYDLMLAGDDQDIVMSDRPEFRAVRQATDRPAFVRAYARSIRMLSGRVGPLLGTLLAHGTDPTLLDLMETLDRERLIGTTQAVTALSDRVELPPGWTGAGGLSRLIDAVWTLNSPEVFDRLVRRRGWSHEQYEAWFAGQLDALFVDSVPAR